MSLLRALSEMFHHAPRRFYAQRTASRHLYWALCGLLGRSSRTSLLLAFSETFDQSPWSHIRKGLVHIRKGHVDITAGRYSTFEPVDGHVPFNCLFLISLPGRFNTQLAHIRMGHLDITSGI